MMTKREQYAVSFQRIPAPYSGSMPIATTTNIHNAVIAGHISDSNLIITQIQIADLQKALNGEPVEIEWGEIMGSTLEIYANEGTVQIGYTDRRIPIHDFKELLEEWLAFIS
jgi:hypothetical protein